MTAKSLKDKIKEMRNGSEDDDIQPSEYDNLILDEMDIQGLTTEDCAYLATFTSLDRLSLNQTHLKSLDNFPKNENLVRLELAENLIPGSELVHLGKYASSLQTLKLASNKIGALEDLDHLSGLQCLKNLDLENNDVAKADGYREKLFKMLPALEVLDNCNKDGVEVMSEDEDDYGSYGEEGEADMDAALTEEQIEELKRKGISVEDFMNGMGDFDEEGEDDFDGFEGGEDELDEDSELEKLEGETKRAKH